ncbi:porphobilinogen deaminase [Neoconidiobolus thromboides FSU 785]|nr:porphobilinogen deaminase [Neoconidiobolus thromboides FSU 785]
MITKMEKNIYIGTRKSQLALVQAEFVKGELHTLYPNLNLSLEKISTIGDKILDKALSKIGEKSLFTKELEVALKDGTVDLVVHSLKDLPTTLPPGMALGAVMEREDPHDAVVMSLKNKGLTIDKLPKGSVIGTSSVRRISQLRRNFPNLEFQDVRGNLNTRISKLDDENGPYDALILAVAGLKRLGWESRISQVLAPDLSLHAVGQGALGIECRMDDEHTLELLSKLDHRDTRLRCTAERAMMRKLEGGCSVPIGVATTFKDNKLSLRGMVASIDGKKFIEYTHEQDVSNGVDEAEKVGEKVADELLKLGAREILDSIRHNENVTELPFGK